jgi:hypothetical protein
LKNILFLGKDTLFLIKGILFLIEDIIFPKKEFYIQEKDMSFLFMDNLFLNKDISFPGEATYCLQEEISSRHESILTTRGEGAINCAPTSRASVVLTSFYCSTVRRYLPVVLLRE